MRRIDPRHLWSTRGVARPLPPGGTGRAGHAVLGAAAVAVLAASVFVAVVHGGAPGSHGTIGAPAHGHRPAPARGPATAATRHVALADDDNLPADCIPNPVGPPTAPYQLGLVGTLHDGTLTAGPATVADINATFCGVVTLVNSPPPCGVTGSVYVPPDGQVFGPLSVALTLVPGMTPTIGFTANPATITGGFSCTASSSNGLDVSLEATVSGTTSGIFGVSCTIGPLTIPLTGVITGPLTALTGTLTSNDFAVPTVQSSPTCPGSVPANIDAIAGLPLAAGGGTATLPVSASLYQPAS
jgi:hypothetical protein